MKELAELPESPLVDELMMQLKEQSIGATVTVERNVVQHYAGGTRTLVIWLEDEADLERATEILDSLKRAVTCSHCPQCGYDLKGHTGPTQCPECGTELTAPTPDVTCPHCGEQAPGNFEVCWNCGQAITGEGES